MIIHDCIQGTDDWHKLRLGKVTASRFSDAMAGGAGKTRKAYMIKLIAERLTGEPQEGYTNAVMQRGNEIEPHAREYYNLLNDITVKEVGFVELDENIGASPDGLVGEEGLLEIKCPNSATHIEYLLAGKLPATYKRQVQGQLWVTDREWCDFVSYDPRVTSRPYFCERIDRDNEYIKDLRIGIQMFVTEMARIMEKLTENPY